MKKTAKRILALVLTLCTVFCMMVPAAWAESNAITYDFTSTGGQKGQTWDIIRNATTKAFGTSNFAQDQNGILVKFGITWDACDPSLEIDGSTVKGKNGRWFAIELKGIPAGTYDAQFAMSSIKNGGYANVFIVDSAEYKTAEAVYFPDGDAGLNLEETNELFEKLNFIKEAKYDSCYATYGGYNAKQEIGEVTFDKTGDYVLIFQCYGRSSGDHPQLSTKSLTLTPVVTEVSIEDKITNANSGDTIVLEEDAKVGSVEIKDGVTLDLNGNTLEATSVTCLGSGVVTDTSNGKGLIKVTSGAVVNADSSHLAVYDSRENANGYRVYSASVASYKPAFANKTDATDGVKFLFTLNFTNKDAYAAIATGESGLAVKGTWSVNDQELSFPAETVKDWANAQNTAQEGQTYALYVNVKGMEAVETLTITPKVGALSAAAIEYTKQ